MGRQIPILVSIDDCRLFENRVAEGGGVLLQCTQDSATPIALGSSDGVEQRFNGVFFVCLAKEIGQVEFRYIETMGYWMVEDTRSPVVEYTFGLQDGRGLGNGRLYYGNGYFEGEDWVPHSDDFNEFADSLFRWVRRYFVRDRASGVYVGPFSVGG
jgi:hypothetical protein